MKFKPGLIALVLALLLCAGGPAAAADRCDDRAPWCDVSLTADDRARLLLAALTQQQKIALLSGDDLLGVTGLTGHTGTNAAVPGLVPAVNFTDGTAGIRQGQATALPVEIAIAASFDPALARAAGGVLGDEAKKKGNDVLYGPTLTIMRTPLAGRTFQGLGEDPFLASQLGVGLIKGVQAEGVIADANIYTANNQEGQDPTGLTARPGSPLGVAIIGSRLLADARVDERTLREIYLPPFEAAVKRARVGTVMCAYNLVNGVYNCENERLLEGVLKGEWGFPGMVLADYAAAHNPVASLRGGLDFEPWPGIAYSFPAVNAALLAGLVSDDEIDEHVRRYLRTLFAFGVFDRPSYVKDDSRIDKAAHAATAQRIEEGAITLLHNRDGVLPLDAGRLKSIAVIGRVADSFLTGGGSSAVDPFSNVTPLQGIRDRAGGDVNVRYDDGSDAARAAALARNSDIAVVVAANYQSEGADLPCLTLECPDVYGDQDGLIAAVAKANPRTIVVLETGGPVLTPWRDDVAALLAAWYPGQQGGVAIARVLFGDIDPGGRLPVTFPRSEADLPTAGDAAAYPGNGTTVRYKEGVFVGYRWFDEQRLEPAFPFGHGLSYARFSFRRLTVRRTNTGARVTVTVVNTGRRSGIAVPQLYVGKPGPHEPPTQLRGFRKLELAPGRRRRVTFTLGPRAFEHWENGGWRRAPGCYRLMVGASSRSLPLQRSLCARRVLAVGGCANCR